MTMGSSEPSKRRGLQRIGALLLGMALLELALRLGALLVGPHAPLAILP